MNNKTDAGMDIGYYDRFAKVYDLISSKSYYHKPRKDAIEKLNIKPGQDILNIPCGTGQNFEYFQEILKDTGSIVGVDLSAGMLKKAEKKIALQDWSNITLIPENVLNINQEWVNSHLQSGFRFDAVLCDLGLSGFPEWEKVIDNLISVLKPGGTIVIMDWYIEKKTLRGAFIKWIGKGEVNRPLYQYLSTKVSKFELNNEFKNGQMFVASGHRKLVIAQAK